MSDMDKARICTLTEDEWEISTKCDRNLPIPLNSESKVAPSRPNLEGFRQNSAFVLNVSF